MINDSRLDGVNRQRADGKLVEPKLKNETVLRYSWIGVNEKKELAQTRKVYFEDDVPEEIGTDQVRVTAVYTDNWCTS